MQTVICDDLMLSKNYLPTFLTLSGLSRYTERRERNNKVFIRTIL